MRIHICRPHGREPAGQARHSSEAAHLYGPIPGCPPVFRLLDFSISIGCKLSTKLQVLQQTVHSTQVIILKGCAPWRWVQLSVLGICMSAVTKHIFPASHRRWHPLCAAGAWPAWDVSSFMWVMTCQTYSVILASCTQCAMLVKSWCLV